MLLIAIFSISGETRRRRGIARGNKQPEFHFVFFQGKIFRTFTLTTVTDVTRLLPAFRAFELNIEPGKG